jgi:hypothetical protein
MRLLPSDPDVETIVSRIKSGDINLQPGFQRGEVWGKLKKQRLIDSILRDWHVPPIHVIENPHSRKQEVLDGQQRLVAIRDFVAGQIAVDGTVEPHEEGISSLDGLFYQQLPDEWRRRFNQFTIRIFRIVDYRPSEPGELFFRLNQPTSLTGAEQRNAFFGPVREKIKGLVEDFSGRGIEKDVLGFSNSRMSYDDVFARLALAIERKTVAEKITSSDLADLYRQEEPLQSGTIDLIHTTVELFASAKRVASHSPRFNKATLFSWLIFLVRGHLHGYRLPKNDLSQYLEFFQSVRSQTLHVADTSTRLLDRNFGAGSVFAIYESRSAARVADVSSVVLRDAVLWLVFEQFVRISKTAAIPNSINIQIVLSAFDSQRSPLGEDDVIARHLIEEEWGQLS